MSNRVCVYQQDNMQPRVYEHKALVLRFLSLCSLSYSNFYDTGSSIIQAPNEKKASI